MVWIFIIFTQGAVDGMYIGINEQNEIGFLVRTNNVIFLELRYGYNWTRH